MTRSGYPIAAGVVAVVVVAGAVAVLRSDQPVPVAEPVAVPSMEVSAATTTGPTPLTSLAAPATISTVGDFPTTSASELEATMLVAESEPAVEFLEDPILVEPVGGRTASGGKQAYTENGEKGDSVAQGGSGTVATTSTTFGEPAVDFGDDPDQVASPKETTASTSASSGPRGSGRRGRMYTWEDGDHTRQVWLDPELAVKGDAATGPLGEAVVQVAEGSAVRGDGGSGESGLPVFRSPSGALMALPGGVLLLLDSGWTEAETSAFFSRNGIKGARVSELDYLPNGFFVETDPGFPSLNLANDLADQDGVELSSPNWWTESTTR